MSVSCRSPRELGPAVGAGRLGRLARLLALVSQEVAERRKLAAVASVLPALRLGSALHYSDLATLVVAVRCHYGRNLVHHPLLLPNRKRRWSISADLLARCLD